MIYIAQRDYGLEGFKVIGVFDTPEKAKTCCELDKENSLGHEIQECELNGVINGIYIAPLFPLIKTSNHINKNDDGTVTVIPYFKDL